MAVDSIARAMAAQAGGGGTGGSFDIGSGLEMSDSDPRVLSNTGVLNVESTEDDTDAEIGTFKVVFKNEDDDKIIQVKGFNTAGTKSVDTELDDETTQSGLPSSEAVKTYLEGYGNTIRLSMNTSTYVLTAQLKHGDDVVSYSTVDLPIESMVVSARYDADTKKIILTLQSGQEIEVPVSQLISGLVPDSRKIAGIDLADDITKAELQTALNVEDGANKTIIDTSISTSSTDTHVPSSKAVYDLVDGFVTESELESHTGNSTVHVTSSDKSTWNSKYTIPEDGIPMNDLSQEVQDAIEAGGGGGYVKPDDGIPSSDMTAEVQASLAKADTAIQSSDLSGYATTTQLNAKYSKPSSGIPASDLTSSVQTSLGKADTAIQSSDLAEYATKTEVNAKYSKPSSGIPVSDLSTAVQSSLSKADSALQAHQSLANYSTTSQMNSAINSAVNGKYSKPSTGIPATDLESDIQNTLNAVTNKYNKPSSGIPLSDMTSTVQASLNKADSAVQTSDLSNYSTTAQMNAAINTAISEYEIPNYNYSGSVTTQSSLPTASGHNGERWYCTTDDKSFQSNGSSWVQIPTNLTSLEAFNARTNAAGTEFSSLKARLDNGDTTVSELSDYTYDIIESMIGLSKDDAYAVINNYYIRDNGTVGSGSGLKIYYFVLKKGHKYVVRTPGNVLKIAERASIPPTISEAQLQNVKIGSSRVKTYTPTVTYTFIYSDSDNFRIVDTQEITGIKNSIIDVKETALKNYHGGSIEKEMQYNAIRNFTKVYIGNDGSTGTDNNNTGRYFKVYPGALIKITVTTNTSYLTVADHQNPWTYGMSFAGRNIFKSNTTGTFEYVCASDAHWIYIYTATADFGNVTIEEFVPTSRYQLLTVPMESGSLLSANNGGQTSDERSAHIGWIRSKYTYKVPANCKVRIKNKTSAMTKVRLRCYGSDKAYTALYNLAGEKYIIPAETEVYFRVEIEDSTRPIHDVELEIISSTEKTNARKNFLTHSETEWFTYDVNDNMYTFGRMLIPPNYDETGKPVPLVVFMPGSGELAAWTSGFSSAKLHHLRYVRDEGFAVASFFGWGSNLITTHPNCGKSFNYPTPTNIECMKTGIEWVCDRYNIDINNIHIVSKSQGGQGSLYQASYPCLPGIRSIASFAPVVDYFSMPGEDMYADARAALVSELHLTGDTTMFSSTGFNMYSTAARTFIELNIDKFRGMNEKWTNLVGGTAASRLEDSLDDAAYYWDNEAWTDASDTTYYTHSDRAKITKVPIRFYGASDDAATPWRATLEVAEQIKNGGGECSVVEYNRNTGGHSAADDGQNLEHEITTSLGIECTYIGKGWIDAVTFFRDHMPK